ncbi:hypothetical protein AABV93_001785 [Enterobacter hormaechei]|nr:MAG TPA: hypothetical protein [Caudoviricetes sp.]
MQITCGDIQVGQVFYGTKTTGDFHEIVKLKALTVTAKQVKAKHQRHRVFGSEYTRTLRSADWCFFNDFESAREYWIANKLSKDVDDAERRLARCKALIDEINKKTDI